MPQTSTQCFIALSISRTTMPICRISPKIRLILSSVAVGNPEAAGSVGPRSGEDQIGGYGTNAKPGAGSPRPAHPLRLPALCAVVRHVRIFLSADGWGAGVHAAAGPPCHRRIPAGDMGGTARR